MKRNRKTGMMCIAFLIFVVAFTLCAGSVVFADYTYYKFKSGLFITPYEYQGFVGDYLTYKLQDANSDGNMHNNIMTGNYYFYVQRSGTSSIADNSSDIVTITTGTVSGGVFSYKITEEDAGKYLRVYIRPQTTTGNAYVSNWRIIPDNRCGADADRKNVKWDYDVETAEFTMTGSGATYNYKPSDQGPSISQELRPWARNVIYNYAKNVKVGEGITVLGGNSFYKFSALTSVSLPSTLKELKGAVFVDCSSLTEVKLPEGLKSIGQNCFSRCTKLKKINIPSTVVSIDEGSDGVFHKIASDHVISVYAGTAGSKYVRKKGLNGDFDLSTAKIIGVEDKVWSESGVTQQLTVMDNDTTLKEGTDYKVSYKNNKEVGTATLTITGTGSCSGSQSVTFSILPAAPSGNTTLKYQNESLDKVEARILGLTTNSDVEGSVYSILQAKAKVVKNKRIQLQWKTLNQADGYIIYSAMYGKAYEKYADIENSNIGSITVQGLQKGRYYKCIVAAYRKTGSGKTVLTTSKTVYAATSGGKFGNPKKVTVGQKKLRLKAGNRKKVSSSVTKGTGKVKQRRKLSWESTNENIAKVNKNGRITAVSKGTCFVYAYAQNGIMARIKVTVP